MDHTFYVGHDELYQHAKFGEDRTTRAGCRCENVVFVFFYRQDAGKRQTAGIVFTHRTKIRFYAPQGRLVAPIQVKLCSTDGRLGPLSCAKFHVNRCRRGGGECGPQNIKNFHFLVKSLLAGATPLTDFQNV